MSRPPRKVPSRASPSPADIQKAVFALPRAIMHVPDEEGPLDLLLKIPSLEDHTRQKE